PLVAILPAAPVSLGQLQDPVATTPGFDTLLDAHGLTLVGPVGEQFFDHLLRIHLLEVTGAAVGSLAVGSLGEGHQVLRERLPVLHLPALLHVEPLLRAAPGLHLRHCSASSLSLRCVLGRGWGWCCCRRRRRRRRRCFRWSGRLL